MKQLYTHVKATMLCFLLFFGITKNSMAQYTKLFDFTYTVDVYHPMYSQFVSDGTWYYAASTSGGVYNNGVLFKIKPDGTNYTKLLDFNYVASGYGPYGALVLANNVLYGITNTGGLTQKGVIYKINTDGTGFTKLKEFSGKPDGANPYGSLILSGGVLYGMTSAGGANDKGCIFSINIDGTAFTKLKEFSGIADGANPYGSLTLSGGVLYGMTFAGGANDLGCIFSINTDGSTFSKLLDFSGTANGSKPYGALTLSGNMLFGMASAGGSKNYGCIFKLNTDGSSYIDMQDFDFTVNGSNPKGSLIISGSTLFGMTSSGGSSNGGTIVKINTDVSGFAKLSDLSGGASGSLFLSGNVLYGMTDYGGTENAGTFFKINADGTSYAKLMNFDLPGNGSYPRGITIGNNVLYVTTSGGGANGIGCIFKINPDGTEYTKLRDFSVVPDGSAPIGSLVLSGTLLYGEAYGGGTNNVGCIFKMNTDGTGYTNLFSFNSGISSSSSGFSPMGTLALSGGILYGITSNGGTNNRGTIFKFDTNSSVFTKLQDNVTIPSGLSLYGGVLYGVTTGGGTGHTSTGTVGGGTIFKMNIDGSNFSAIHNFDNTADSASAPYSAPIMIDNVLYGTTNEGGKSQYGALYKINADGTGFTNVKILTFADGIHPYGSLTAVGTTLYGMTYRGGLDSPGSGTVFKYTIPDNRFTKIKDFGIYINGGQAYDAPLIFSSGTLYGVTLYNGTANKGVVFSLVTTPDVQATAVGNTQTNLTWTNGNGIKRIVFIKQGTGTFTGPVNNTPYLASTDWNNKGTQVGTSGYYCVYDGTGNGVDITNLSPGLSYTVQVCEYNGSTGTQQYLTSAANGNPYTFALPKLNPVVTWNNPADITYGTLLGTNQLNAKSDIPGTFVYTPAAGTKLEVGNNQSLKADFTPTDAVSYNTASKTVIINVSQATGVGNLNTDNDIKIYPNPCVENIVIESTKAYCISILELNGKLMTEVITKGQLKNTIPVKKLLPGAYIIVLKDLDNNILMVKRIEKF